MKKLKDIKLSKKMFAFVLSAALVFSMVPVSYALATNNDTSVNNDTSTSEQEQQTDSKDNTDAVVPSDKSEKTTDTSKDSSNNTEEKTNENQSTNESDNNESSASSSMPEETENISNQESVNSDAEVENNSSESTNSTDEASLQDSNDSYSVITSPFFPLAASSVNYTEDPYSGTCRKSGTLQYYASLDIAIEDLKDTGGTIEIYKDTSLSQSHTITQNFTIKNITDPGTLDPINPKKNGSTHVQPQVSVADGGQLLIDGGTISFEGVYIDGHNVNRTTSTKVSAGTVAVEHNPTSAIVIKSGMVSVMDGVAGTDVAKLDATATVFCNFNNSGEGGGVFCIVGGDVMVDSGTFSQNTSSANGGVFGMLEGGMVSVTGGTFSNNKAVYGGVICADAANASNAGIINIAGATFKGNSTTSGGGGFAFLGTGATMNLAAGTITENSTANSYGSAIDVHSGILNVSGNPSIEKNVAAANGAIYVDPTNGNVSLAGSPRIVNNNGHNLTVGAASQVIVEAEGLTRDARVGISNLVTSGVQFATTDSSKTAANTPYVACFSNDTNPALIPDTDATTATTTAIKWREIGSFVCYIDNAGIVTYYTSLQKALAAAKGNARTIEIFKSHNFALGTATVQEVNSNIAIMNVNAPLNDGIDWKYGTVNGGAEPVVTFETGSQINYSAGTSTLKGVVFNGQNNNARVIPGVLVATGATLNIDDGDMGKSISEKDVKTSTVIKDFYNNHQTFTTTGGGGFSRVSGTLNINSGTISGCKAIASGFTNGGAVAKLIDGGTVNVYSGSYIKDNGCGQDAAFDMKSRWGDSTFGIYKGHLYIYGGEFTGNIGSCGGVACMYGNGDVNSVYMEGGLAKNNLAHQHGGFVYSEAGALTLKGTAIITENTCDGLQGGESSVIEVRSASSKMYLGGSVQITNNRFTGTTPANKGCAISAYLPQLMGYVDISGHPRIYGNTGPNGEANIAYNYNDTNYEIQRVAVHDMEPGARIGYYSSIDNLAGDGKQFGYCSAGTTEANLKNIAGSFTNDRYSNLVSVTTTGSNAITWGSAVVKETTGSTGTGGFVKYYDSLNNALTNVTSGNTLEILKTHTLTANATLAAGKTCYIRNVVNPANDTENPFKTTDASGKLVYEAANEPIVYFAKSDTAYRLTISGTCTCEGVKFSGYSWTGVSGVAPVANNRSLSGILVSAGASLTLNNGVKGVLPDSTATSTNERMACETFVTSFKNTSGTTDDTGGGFLSVYGTVTMKKGSITDCHAVGGWKNGVNANSHQAAAGGAVACVLSSGIFNLYDGDIYSNGDNGGYYAIGPFAIHGGKFNMYGGTGRDNLGGCAGFVFSGSSNTQIYVGGGTVKNNIGSVSGGAFFLWEKNYETNQTLTIEGNTVVQNNKGGTAGAIEVRDGGTYYIRGNTRIINNQCTGKTAESGGGALGGWSPDNQGKVYVSGNPVIWGNTATDGTANYRESTALNVGTNLIVENAGLGKAAKIGVYSKNNEEVNERFATHDTTTASNYLAGFYNDKNSNLRGQASTTTAGAVIWAEVTPTVKVTETVTTTNETTGAKTYTDIIHIFGGKTAISDAFACVASLPTENVIASDNENRPYIGYFPIELLKQTDDTSYKLSSQVTINTGTTKKVLFTTAMTEAQETATGMTKDGYYGPGTNVPATIYRAVANVALFNLTSGDITVKNLIVDGQKASYTCNNSTGLFCLADGNGKLTLSDGSTLQNSKTVGEGGAIRLNPSSKLVMEGSSEAARAIIKNCVGQGGAIAAWRASIEMKGYAKIDSCEATYSTYTKGGAIIAWSSNFSMTGNAEISGCTAALHSAISLGLSTGDAKRETKISGSAKIQNNTCTGTASATYQTVAVGKVGGHDVTVEVSGSPYIYNNTAPGIEQANLGDLSDENTGADIKVGEEGFSTDATIGVTSVNNADSGDTFARTVSASAASSTNSANLERFVNDKDTSLKGHAGDGDAVVWSKLVPLNIVINLDEAATDDMWFTLQVQSATTGERSRIALCVPKGSKTGSTVALENSNVKNSFKLISGGSPNGYSLSTPTLKNTPTAASGQTIGANETLETSVSFLCFLTLSSACSKKGEIDSTSGIRELTFNASWSSPTDTTKLSGQSGVTNTINF